MRLGPHWFLTMRHNTCGGRLGTQPASLAHSDESRRRQGLLPEIRRPSPNRDWPKISEKPPLIWCSGSLSSVLSLTRLDWPSPWLATGQIYASDTAVIGMQSA